MAAPSQRAQLGGFAQPPSGITHNSISRYSSTIQYPHLAMSTPRHTASPALLVALLAAGSSLSGCGGSSKHATAIGHAASVAVPALAPAGSVVVQVGGTPITGAVYNHWMAIGAATVEMPKPGRPLPKALEYRPPDFTACIASLRTSTPGSTTSQLRQRCRHTYEGIRARVLDFLITGYWLREEAANKGVAVSRAEVRMKFEEERRTHYPSAASFRALQEASRQRIPDMEFAVQTQMLSQKLLERFMTTQGRGQPEQAAIAAFNRNLRNVWTAKTNCRPEYVVSDCRQYKK
jgi:hypothetical protein